jgi:hypothetical protein
VRDRGAGWKQTALRKAAALAGRFHPPAKEKLEQWEGACNGKPECWRSVWKSAFVS